MINQTFNNPNQFLLKIQTLETLHGPDQPFMMVPPVDKKSKRHIIYQHQLALNLMVSLAENIANQSKSDRKRMKATVASLSCKINIRKEKRGKFVKHSYMIFECMDIKIKLKDAKVIAKANCQCEFPKGIIFRANADGTYDFEIESKSKKPLKQRDVKALEMMSRQTSAHQDYRSRSRFPHAQPVDPKSSKEAQDPSQKCEEGVLQDLDGLILENAPMLGPEKVNQLRRGVSSLAGRKQDVKDTSDTAGSSSLGGLVVGGVVGTLGTLGSLGGYVGSLGGTFLSSIGGALFGQPVSIAPDEVPRDTAEKDPRVTPEGDSSEATGGDTGVTTEGTSSEATGGDTGVTTEGTSSAATGGDTGVAPGGSTSVTTEAPTKVVTVSFDPALLGDSGVTSTVRVDEELKVRVDEDLFD